MIQWNCHRRHRGLPMEKLATDTLHAEYDKLLFAARRSVRYVRYHRHRQRFLDRVHDLGALRTAFGGSATVAAVVADLPAGWTWVLPTVAALTAFAGAHELVFGTARGARRHDALARDFVMLEEQLLRARPTLTPEPLIKLQTRRLDIEATEPPVYRVLDATSHDELVTALGRDPSQRTNVTRWQRLWRHLFDVGAHGIRKQAR